MDGSLLVKNKNKTREGWRLLCKSWQGYLLLPIYCSLYVFSERQRKVWSDKDEMDTLSAICRCIKIVIEGEIISQLVS